MSISEDKWFEVWYLQGVDVTPSCLYIVTPSPKNPGQTIILDPYNGNRVVYEGRNYEAALNWLREDDFTLVEGRVFPDDGWA